MPALPSRLSPKRLPRLLLTATTLFLLAGCGATEAPVSPTSTPTAATANTPLVTYKGHSAGVGYLAWSPDGKRIATSTADLNGQYPDSVVEVWNASTGATTLTYHGHKRNTWAVVWSSDGKHVASASGDGTVQIWDPTMGTPSLIYKGHGSPVYIAAWSPDGSKIASGDSAGGVQVWRAE